MRTLDPHSISILILIPPLSMAVLPVGCAQLLPSCRKRKPRCMNVVPSAATTRASFCDMCVLVCFAPFPRRPPAYFQPTETFHLDLWLNLLSCFPSQDQQLPIQYSFSSPYFIPPFPPSLAYLIPCSSHYTCGCLPHVGPWSLSTCFHLTISLYKILWLPM